MSGKLTNQQILELLPLYALGALEPAEMLDIAEYLEQHPDLQQRFHELDDAAQQLAYAAPALVPSHTNRDQLLARVQRDLQPAPAAEIDRAPSPPVPAARRRPAPSRWAYAAACLTLLLALLGAYTLQLQGQVARLSQNNQQLQQQLQLQNEQVALIADADTSVALAGTENAPTASGVFYEDNGRGVFVIRGLSVLPEGQTYQLWLVPPGGTPTSVGLLAVADDTATATVDVPPGLRRYAIVDVSIEPAGGSPAINTQTIVLRGTTG